MLPLYKKILAVGIIAFAVPLTVYLTIQGVKYFSKATVDTPVLSFLPNPVVISTSSPTIVSAMLDAKTEKIGFVKVQFSFDKTKIRLTDEITTTTSLKKVVAKTTMAEANSTGAVTLIMGLDPQDVNNPPTGSFQLAQMSFQATSQFSASALSFISTDMEIVNMTPIDIAPNVINADINFGATPTPTATATPTAIPTPTATVTGTPTPTATATATATDTPTTASVNFKIKFQGINVKGPDQKVDVTLKQNGTLVNTLNNINMLNDSSGVYSGIIADVAPGTYDIYIKNLARLGVKIAGAVLAVGSNDKDWSTSTLKAGDFNNDNKLNILDIGLILSKYVSINVAVDANNQLYDVNGDGTINILDVGLVLSNYTTIEILGE